MTTPTSMGNHGGTVTSCSPYAYPGFAEICILLRTWSTVTPGTCELAFLIKKKKIIRGSLRAHSRVSPPFRPLFPPLLAHTSPFSHQHRSAVLTMSFLQELERACTHTYLHTCTRGDKHTNIQTNTLRQGHQYPNTYTHIHHTHVHTHMHMHKLTTTFILVCNYLACTKTHGNIEPCEVKG